MGWTITYKDPRESAADFLARECLTWRLPPEAHPEVVTSAAGPGSLASAVRFPAAYWERRSSPQRIFLPAADGSVVTALVFLINGGESGRRTANFGYKDMHETMGPCTPVSASILRYLSALDLENGGDAAKWAKGWRDRCKAYTNGQDANRLHAAGALFNCCTDLAEPDWSDFSRLEIGACRQERQGESDLWTVNAVDDAQATFWTVYGRRKADDALSAECEAITDCNTREQAGKVAGILSARSGLPVFRKAVIGRKVLAAPVAEGAR